MNRRVFISRAVAVLAAPLAAEAQQAGKVPKLGYLSNSSNEEAADSAFTQALRDLGWVDGQTIIVEARYTAGSLQRPPEFVRDFIGRGVDTIVAWSPFAVAAAKRGTVTVPIVGLSMGDPVAAGLMSLAEYTNVHRLKAKPA
jgi:putative tryptophan/tyrosine transport system substrate-binding protein